MTRGRQKKTAAPFAARIALLLALAAAATTLPAVHAYDQISYNDFTGISFESSKWIEIRTSLSDKTNSSGWYLALNSVDLPAGHSYVFVSTSSGDLCTDGAGTIDTCGDSCGSNCIYHPIPEKFRDALQKLGTGDGTQVFEPFGDNTVVTWSWTGHQVFRIRAECHGILDDYDGRITLWVTYKSAEGWVITTISHNDGGGQFSRSMQQDFYENALCYAKNPLTVVQLINASSATPIHMLGFNTYASNNESYLSMTPNAYPLFGKQRSEHGTAPDNDAFYPCVSESDTTGRVRYRCVSNQYPAATPDPCSTFPSFSGSYTTQSDSYTEVENNEAYWDTYGSTPRWSVDGTTSGAEYLKFNTINRPELVAIATELPKYGTPYSNAGTISGTLKMTRQDDSTKYQIWNIIYANVDSTTVTFVVGNSAGTNAYVPDVDTTGLTGGNSRQYLEPYSIDLTFNLVSTDDDNCHLDQTLSPNVKEVWKALGHLPGSPFASAQNVVADNTGTDLSTVSLQYDCGDGGATKTIHLNFEWIGPSNYEQWKITSVTRPDGSDATSNDFCLKEPPGCDLSAVSANNIDVTGCGDGSTLAEDTSCTVSCTGNNIMDGDATLSCSAGGTISGPTCRAPNNCTVTVSNGNCVAGDSLSHDASCEVECTVGTHGLASLAEATVTCHDGTPSAVPTCHALVPNSTASPVTLPADGVISVRPKNVGKAVRRLIVQQTVQDLHLVLDYVNIVDTNGESLDWTTYAYRNEWAYDTASYDKGTFVGQSVDAAWAPQAVAGMNEIGGNAFHSSHTQDPSRNRLIVTFKDAFYIDHINYKMDADRFPESVTWKLEFEDGSTSDHESINDKLTTWNVYYNLPAEGYMPSLIKFGEVFSIETTLGVPLVRYILVENPSTYLILTELEVYVGTTKLDLNTHGSIVPYPYTTAEDYPAASSGGFAAIIDGNNNTGTNFFHSTSSGGIMVDLGSVNRVSSIRLIPRYHPQIWDNAKSMTISTYKSLSGGSVATSVYEWITTLNEVFPTESSSFCDPLSCGDGTGPLTIPIDSREMVVDIGGVNIPYPFRTLDMQIQSGLTTKILADGVLYTSSLSPSGSVSVSTNADLWSLVRVDSELAFGDAAAVSTILCGDAIIHNGEACDDGNKYYGDGCGSDCQIQPRYECTPTTLHSGADFETSEGTCLLQDTECGDGLIDNSAHFHTQQQYRRVPFSTMSATPNPNVTNPDECAVASPDLTCSVGNTEITFPGLNDGVQLSKFDIYATSETPPTVTLYSDATCLTVIGVSFSSISEKVEPDTTRCVKVEGTQIHSIKLYEAVGHAEECDSKNPDGSVVSYCDPQTCQLKPDAYCKPRPNPVPLMIFSAKRSLFEYNAMYSGLMTSVAGHFDHYPRLVISETYTGGVIAPTNYSDKIVLSGYDVQPAGGSLLLGNSGTFTAFVMLSSESTDIVSFTTDAPETIKLAYATDKFELSKNGETPVTLSFALASSKETFIALVFDGSAVTLYAANEGAAPLNSSATLAYTTSSEVSLTEIHVATIEYLTVASVYENAHSEQEMLEQFQFQDVYGAGRNCTEEARNGDGVVDNGEECDDGNAVDDDGCSASSAVEDNYSCSNTILWGDSDVNNITFANSAQVEEVQFFKADGSQIKPTGIIGDAKLHDGVWNTPGETADLSAAIDGAVFTFAPAVKIEYIRIYNSRSAGDNSDTISSVSITINGDASSSFVVGHATEWNGAGSGGGCTDAKYPCFVDLVHDAEQSHCLRVCVNPTGVYAATCTGVTQGNTCNIGCSANYEGSPVDAVCQPDGDYDTLPTCEPKKCTALPTVPADGSTTCNTSMTNDQTCTVSCGANYQADSITYTCEAATQQFSPESTLSCNLKTCDTSTLPSTDGTNYSHSCGSSINIHDKCTYSCNVGFTGESTNYTCNDGGGFTGSPPVCVPSAVSATPQCTAPNFNSDSSTCTAGSSYDENYVCSYTCPASGYIAASQLAYTCDGSATQFKPNTIVVTVQDDGSGNRFYLLGSFRPSLNLMAGQEYTFDISGTSDPTHIFKIKDSVSGAESGVKDGDMYTFTPEADKTYAYYCHYPSHNMGAAISVQDNLCEAVTCPGNPSVLGTENSAIDCSSYNTFGGGDCQASCKAGYEGSASVYECGAGTSWQTKTAGTCEKKTCSNAVDLSTIPNASSTTCDGSKKFEETCEIACAVGYQGGSTSIQCQADGTYDVAGVECTDIPFTCQNGGTKRSDESCICAKGYYGNECEIPLSAIDQKRLNLAGQRQGIDHFNLSTAYGITKKVFLSTDVDMPAFNVYAMSSKVEANIHSLLPSKTFKSLLRFETVGGPWTATGDDKMTVKIDKPTDYNPSNSPPIFGVHIDETSGDLTKLTTRFIADKIEFDLTHFSLYGTTEYPPICNNSQMEQGEMCDDGNNQDGDGCSSTCTVEEHWSCTGDFNTESVCIKDCNTLPACPTGQYRSGCVDNDADHGTCTNCNNAGANQYYTSNGGLSSTCTAVACPASSCSLGQYLDGCGGTSSGTCTNCENAGAFQFYSGSVGFSSTCTVTVCDAATCSNAGKYLGGCGNGAPGACADCTPNNAPGARYLSAGAVNDPDSCTVGKWNDGVKDALGPNATAGASNTIVAEECENSGVSNTDQCTDGILSDHYQCQSGSAHCTIFDPKCGSGAMHGVEQCDDENTNSLDGCSPTCTIETGYQCTAATEGSRSVCTPSLCGDDLWAEGSTEECDDGNNQNGDGCESNCKIQSGYGCTRDTESGQLDTTCFIIGKLRL